MEINSAVYELLSEMEEKGHKQDKYEELLAEIAENRKAIYRISSELPTDVGYTLLQLFDTSLMKVEEAINLASSIRTDERIDKLEEILNQKTQPKEDDTCMNEDGRIVIQGKEDYARSNEESFVIKVPYGHAKFNRKYYVLESELNQSS